MTRTRGTIVAAIAGAALAITVVACGSPRGKQAAVPPTVMDHGASPEVRPIPGDPKAEIEALDADIQSSLTRLTVPEPAPMVSGDVPDPRPFSEIRGVCTPPAHPDETCTSVCDLGNHICENADRICTLADELQPDDWSLGKCDTGKKSCEAARKRCCDCQ